MRDSCKKNLVTFSRPNCKTFIKDEGFHTGAKRLIRNGGFTIWLRFATCCVSLPIFIEACKPSIRDGRFHTGAKWPIRNGGFATWLRGELNCRTTCANSSCFYVQTTHWMASNIMLCFILHVFLRVKSIMLIHRRFRASRKQRILSVKLSISLQIGLRKSATSYQHEFKITFGTKLAKACTLVKLYKFIVFFTLKPHD